MEYARTERRGLPASNEAGFAQLAFEVVDLQIPLSRLLASGDAMQDEVSDFDLPRSPHLIVNIRDPDGNLLELEQPGR